MPLKFLESSSKELPLWKDTNRVFPDSSHVVPHTHQAGDAYYIGDIYEPSRLGPSGELIDGDVTAYKVRNPSKTPYLQYLDSLTRGWPHISYLADFMKVTTASPKQKFLTEDDKRERARRTKVAMLTFKPDGIVQRADLCTNTALSQALTGPDDSLDDVHVRLIVVEDLSRDVIEILGRRFRIDPLFFRSHISDYMWHNTRDPWVELPDLDILARERPYFHVRYVQTRYFRDEISLNLARIQAGTFNVLRRVDKDGNWVQEFDIPNSDVGLVRSRTSLWIRPNQAGEKGTLGILLVDPTIKEGFPMWGGPRTLVDCPLIAESPIASEPPRTSFFEDVIYYNSMLTAEEIQQVAEDPRILFKKALLLVCAESYTFVKYASTRIAQLEWEVENPQIQRSQGGLQVTIGKLHGWRRRLPISRTLTSEILEKIIKREHFMNRTQNHLLDLQQDFEIILSTLDDLQLRADRIMNVVTAVMSIEESRKALEQNRSLARLTWLAVTFVPLSFVSSLFSMNSELSTLLGTLRMFFAVAIPLTVSVLVVVRYAGGLE